jgi:hexosaminidase
MTLKMKKLLFLLLLSIFHTGAPAQSNDRNMGIVPAPVSVKKTSGEFKITPEITILADSPGANAVQFFAAYLRKSGLGTSITDVNIIEKKQRNMKNAIILSMNYKGDLPPEGYELSITGDRITLKGRDAGMFYAIQTLIQLIHISSPGYASAPCAEIKDYPRFAYRGMHLDVARHFFDVDFIKQYLDLMAAYKLNNFHWHLTDDQGWRIEIKKYPKLTEIGSQRAQTKVGKVHGNDSDLYDSTPYGGFYTQDQIIDVVEYAHKRYINIVPEIDMPGHSLAAIAAYPELSCDPSKTYKVGETWGVFKDVLCPTDATFKFMDDVLREVMELFPGRYIHIGGDECPKTAWKASDFCRQMIADSGLRDEAGLQSYFMGRMERFVNSQGRSIIGWDEILEGGLAPNATVMSWRGEKGGIAAAQLGHDVIMTPGSGGLYFDHAQSKSAQEPLNIGGNAPLSKTYAYDPTPGALTKEQQKHIIGVQANLWTEYVATPAKAEYMLLPRMLALAEVAWTQKDAKDYNNFLERIPVRLAGLEQEGYDFRVPEPLGASDTTVTGTPFKVELEPLVKGAKIYYTIDGYAPGETTLPYTQPLQINIPNGKSMDFKCIEITPAGKQSIVTDIKMNNGQ